MSQSITPAGVTLEMTRGDVFTEPVVIEGVDWSSDTFKAEVRYTAEHPDLLASLSVSAPVYDATYTVDGVVVGATTFTLSLPSSDTELSGVPLPSNGRHIRLAWDLKRTSRSARSTVFIGPVVLKGSVTQ